MALILAYIIPFQLFIFAYAVIGPLHYLTEINWLHQKAYFIGNRKWILVPIVLAFLFGLPEILSLIDLKSISWFRPEWITASYTWINGCIWVALLAAFGWVFLPRTSWRIVLVLTGLISVFWLKAFPVYNIWIGLLVPTLIHVYFFTLIFMAYGAVKNASRIGLLSCVLMIGIPIGIWLIPVTINTQLLDSVKALYLQNNFHVLNATMGKVLGYADGTTFFFFEPAYYKMQVFIAFAYLYHYLNWFSKTGVIGWHRSLNQQKVIYVVSIWILFLGLVAYNYQLAVTLLLTLSLLHVFLEFPLNFISIRGLVHELKRL
ncbi:MAG: hypothetical protein KDC80_07885 [Saprospiraceae bacterium]|nr:hypothetical protein [Saprospiraceae bacterium]